MSLRLLLDEDSLAKALVALLRTAGHDVVTEAGLTSLDDGSVLTRARSEQRVLLTRNCADFLALHQKDPFHSGILCVYEDQDQRKNLSYPQIVKALANLEASRWDLSGQFVALNAWIFEPAGEG